MFGRLGGEEFGLIMPGCSIEAAFARAERIRLSFAEQCSFLDGQPIKATVSGGVAVSETPSEPLGMLLKYADAALYEAKSDGRNRIKRASWETTSGNVTNLFRVA